MSEEISNNQNQNDTEEITGPSPGSVSISLSKQGLHHIVLNPDHIGIEVLGIESELLFEVVSFLKSDGFNYLQCQGGYDEGAGQKLVCFYHLISMVDIENISKPREVRLKVFLERDGNLSVPSLYSIFRGSDWQERETYDMYGIIFENHPHPKRLLMPEDWKGWPLRKDYVQPDFYEMQDAY